MVNVYVPMEIEGMVIEVDAISTVTVVQLARYLMSWKMRRLVVPLSILASLLAISSRLGVLRPIFSSLLVMLFVRPDVSQAHNDRV